MPGKEKGNKTKKWFWIIGSVFGAVLFIFIALIAFNSWLHQKLETMVREESNGVYNLSLHNIKASPLTGLLSVDSLHLTPDFDKWNEEQKKSADAPRMLMHVRSGKIELNNLSYWNVLLGKAIEMSSLSVASPDISITRMRQDTTSTHEPMHEAAQGMLKGLKINDITVRQGNLTYKHDAAKEAATLAIQDIDLQVNAFQLDSTSFRDENKAYYARRIVLKTAQTTLNTLDGFYQVSVGPAMADTGVGTVGIEAIKVKPLVAAAKMAQEKGEAVTYTKAELEGLNFTGIQFPVHSRTNKVLVHKVALNQPSLSLYKDKKNFQNKGVKPLPHDMVQQIKSSFLIDTIRIKGMYIRYDELAEKATETGHLFITNLNGTITNLSNMPDKMSQKNPAVVQANGRFMGKASMKASVVLPLLDKNGYHTVEAEVNQADPEILNPILEPTNLMSIKSGALQKGYAKMELNNKKATGTMRVLYRDFKVELLSESQGNEQSLGKKVLSKAANALVIKSDNPEKGEKPRIGEITATRDPNRSVFTFWKDGLASGFLSSAGLGVIAEK